MTIPLWAGKYIGVPFKEHGRDRSGVDCWGLVRLVMASELGIFLPSYVGNYESTEDSLVLGALVKDESRLWVSVPRGQEKEGDVIVLRMRGQPMHVGLVVGDGMMLHIEKGINSVLDRYQGPRWKDRIYGFFRHAARE